MKPIVLGLMTQMAELGLGLLLLLGVLHLLLPGSESILTVWMWVWMVLSVLICTIGSSAPVCKG